MTQRAGSSWTRGANRPTVYALAALYSVFILIPICYMLLVSVQSTATAGTQIVPDHWQWSTFQDIWSTVDLSTELRNTVIIAGATGACASVLALGAGYVIARYQFRFRNLFRVSLLASESVPGVMVLLPLYVIYVIVHNVVSVEIIGTYWGIILTYMTFGLPFAIWMMSAYIVDLPVELEEQALVDGARRAQVLRHVVLPLAAPGLVVTFIFTFLLAWNDVLFASVLTTPRTRTLGVGLQAYLAETGTAPQWNQLMASSVVSAVPAVLLFLLVQRWIVRGLSSGSVKG